MDNFKKYFTWFDKNPELIYLDSAATSLKPKCVIESISEYYDSQSTNPHNDDSLFTSKANKKMDECRSLLSELINCDKDEILFSSGATESLNMIAQSVKDLLKPGDEIVLTEFEHSSNLLPWYRLRDECGIKIIFIKPLNSEFGKDDFKKVLNSKTKIVSFTAASNLLGNRYDCNEITKVIKEYNKEILVCVDIAQYIGHHRSDLKLWNVDFAAMSAHKMFGPTGIGAAYIKKDLQNKIKPLRFGGGMNFKVDNNNFCYIDGVLKFEGGTPHIAGMYGWAEAIKFLNKITYETIEKHDNEIYNYLKDNLFNYADIEIYNKNSKSAILAFNFKNVFCQDGAFYLGNKNIIVRSGLSCAKLLNNVINSEGVIRASFYIYNDMNDIKKFVEVIKNFSRKDLLNGII